MLQAIGFRDGSMGWNASLSVTRDRLSLIQNVNSLSCRRNWLSDAKVLNFSGDLPQAPSRCSAPGSRCSLWFQIKISISGSAPDRIVQCDAIVYRFSLFGRARLSSYGVEHLIVLLALPICGCQTTRCM